MGVLKDVQFLLKAFLMDHMLVLLNGLMMDSMRAQMIEHLMGQLLVAITVNVMEYYLVLFLICFDHFADFVSVVGDALILGSKDREYDGVLLGEMGESNISLGASVSEEASEGVRVGVEVGAFVC